METPESVRLSMQTGEWVSSLDYRYAYFHIPMNQNSRKYPFDLPTAPILVKEVKHMAQSHHIHIYKYLDDWLIRAKETCHQHTQPLMYLKKKKKKKKKKNYMYWFPLPFQLPVVI